MFTNKKLTCYISPDIQFLDLQEAEDLIRIILSQGFFHIYLHKKSLDTTLYKAILNFKKTYPDILIFVVHSYLKPFWIRKEIINLPIFDVNDENLSINYWTNRYCDKILNLKNYKIS